MRLSLLILLCIAAAGCATESFRLPMTAQELAYYNSGPALVAYLGQPDASPAVCDPRSQGPHIRCTEKVSRSLVDGLVTGNVDPSLWRRCVDVLIGTAPVDAAAAFIDATSKAYVKLMLDDTFELSTPLQNRLSAMQELYLARVRDQPVHLVVESGMADALRNGIDKARFGPAGRRFAQALLEVDDLEHGKWLGRTVDVARIDELATAGDEKTLRLLIAHLPRPDLRDEARRRVIRMHIATSPFAEVRDHAAAIEAVVMQRGDNPIALAEHPPLSGHLDPQKVPMRGVLVRQHVFQQTATLLAYSGDKPGLSVLPELSLRGALEVQAQGLSRPVTLCAPVEELDPSPCVAVQDVTLDNPVAYLDKDGAFHFVDSLPMHDAVNLAQMREKFLLPVSVGGKRLLAFEWHLYYERPEDLVLSGPTPGSNGPDLSVYADHRDPNRFIFTVSGSTGAMLAVVENADAMAFHVVSAGARGFTGQAGYAGQNGSPGMSGMSASCPGMSGGNGSPGGPGGNGGPGGPGGPGGDGGDVRVQLACNRGQCRDAMALLQATVLSAAGLGGSGGAGGPGGAGGQGGSGGSGTSCANGDGTSTYLSGGSSGYNGPSGSNGPDGPPGQPGRPGRVSVGVAHSGPRG
jgi:hypothetical protein